MKTLLTHADLCRLWRPSDLARDMDVSITCACNWKARDYVPPWYWSQLIEMSERRHGVIVTFRQLAQATEYRRTVFANQQEAA